MTEAACPPDLQTLWARTLGEPGVCVAVLDGPVDLDHPCFVGADLTPVETLPLRAAAGGAACLHGTHVASVIFGGHHSPVKGIAPACRGLIVPIFGDGPGESVAPCSQLDLARAITQAVELGADVINVSGGELEPSGEAHELLVKAVRLCAHEGVLIVAAVGNDGCECLHVPAAIPSVLAVGAMDGAGDPLAFSNWGETYRQQGILAPGQDVPGAVCGGGYARRTGTSSAAAVVSGIAALLASLQLRRRGRSDLRAVRDAILGSAVACDALPIPECGRLLVGRLDAVGATTTLTEGEDMSDQDLGHQESPVGVAAHEAEEARSREGVLEEPAAESAQESTGTAVRPPEVALPSISTSPRAAAEGGLEAADVEASGCGCPCSSAGSEVSGSPLVYTLGQLGVDFGSEARRDSFIQQGVRNPHDPEQLLAYLKENPAHAPAVTWTLEHEATPIYALVPAGAFASEVYETLRGFLRSQVKGEAERVSVPGRVQGSVSLQSGQVVPAILPEPRGLYSWSTKALVKALMAESGDKGGRGKADEMQGELGNFLERVYYELRNLGLSSADRALNFVATNAFQVEFVYRSAMEAGLRLDTIDVERSPICRPGSDCWDVKLVCFHPTKRLEHARMVYRFTVDVSDVIPVTVGKIRQWHVN